MESSFNIVELLGRPINELKENKAMSKVSKDKNGKKETKMCEFNEIVTKTGNTKGIYNNCKEKGVSAFT